jgi:flagellar hook-associated protein 1 FlgK
MGLLSIGVSGLNAHQVALQTTGNNITNANVEGYSRQRADFGTRPAQDNGVGYIGEGTQITGINRIVDQFLITQLRLDTSSFNRLQTVSNNIEQLDSLLASDVSGLSSAVASFFSALEAGADDPSSVPSRQLVLSDAAGLIERFHSLYDRLLQQQMSINDQLGSATEQVTALASGIAELNNAIERSSIGNQGSQPNQLLDEREELLRQLAEIVSVATTIDNTGAMNVFIGNGQPLVIGSSSNTVSVRQSETDPTRDDVVFSSPSSTLVVTNFISGGQMGGVLDYRQNTLDNAFNSLGRIAIGLAGSLNDQQRLGLDLEGNFGQNIFGDINDVNLENSRAIGNNSNAGTGNLSITIDDYNQLTVSDYSLQIIAGGPNYQLVRNSDDSVVSGPAALPAVGSSITTPEGFTINVVSGVFSVGDRFVIQPTKTGADDISLLMQRPQELAYAAAIRTETSVGNLGNGVISAGEVIDIYDASGAFLTEFATSGQLSPPVVIRFNNPPTSFDVLDNTNPVAPVALVPPMAGLAFTAGQFNAVTVGVPSAYTFNLSGSPAAGDEFYVGYNFDASSDNRNAVLMTTLRTDETLDNGTLNFEDAYARLVEQIGSETAQVRISRDASEALLFQSQAARDSLSGVNLDEEAAKLIQFEQAYNASAQVINIARQIFDTMLAAFR